MVFAFILLLVTFAFSAWAGSGVRVLAVTALALILYTPSARKAPLIKDLYVAGLCMAPLYYGSVVSGVQYAWSPYALLALFIIGLFIKGGLVPFHAWLPDAYTSAPSEVSVLLAGIVTKTAPGLLISRLVS